MTRGAILILSILLCQTVRAELPDYGPGQFFLNFSIDSRRANGLFLADPVLRSSFSPDLPVRLSDVASGLPPLPQTSTPLPGYESPCGRC